MNRDPTSVLVLKAIPYQITNGLALILMNVQAILELLPADNLIIVSTLEEVCKRAFCIFDQSKCSTYCPKLKGKHCILIKVVFMQRYTDKIFVYDFCVL